MRIGPKKYWTNERIEALADDLMAWASVKDRESYFLGEFAAENKFPRCHFNTIFIKNKKFAEAYRLAMQIQENWLVKNGLLRKFSETIVMACLNNNHSEAGWNRNNYQRNLNMNFTADDAVLRNKFFGLDNLNGNGNGKKNGKHRV